MRTIHTQINVYQWDELSEDAKQKAIDHARYWNVDHDWWDCTYEDAERIGAKISAFDIGRAWSIDIALTQSVGEVCRTILSDHGFACDTHELAREYYKRKHNGNPFDVEEFTQQLGECYLTMLRDDYEYLTSDECIRQRFEDGDCEFEEDGTIY